MGFRGARQGASEAGSSALGAAENATPEKLCLRVEFFSSSFSYQEGCRRFVRSWRSVVKRSSTRGWIAARWSDAALRMAWGSRSGLISEADFAA
jgi:hypothetical protein